MRIINVVVDNGGVINEINSFVIIEDDDKEGEERQVKAAEELFKKLCIENGYQEEYNEEGELIVSLEDLVDEGYFEGRSYVSILLVWSNVNL